MIEQQDRRRATSVQSLLEGADRGDFEIPTSLQEARATDALTSRALAEAHDDLAKLGTMADAVTPLAKEVLEAVRAGKPLPDRSDRLLKLEQATEQARYRVDVLKHAQEMAAKDLLFGTWPESIITEHLRPALAQVMEEVRDLEPKLEGRSVEGPQNFLRASAAVREAFNKLNDVAYRYDGIRAAQQAAGRLLDGPQVDTGLKFREFRDPTALGITIGGDARRFQPVPEHRLTRLVWTATVGKDEVWMPTPAEQDEQAAAYFERAEKRRFAGHTFATGF